MRIRKKTKSKLVAPTHFKIPRNAWNMNTANRVSGEASLLLSPDGTMCCLGHFAHACGVGVEHLLCQNVPVNLLEKGIKVPRLIKHNETHTQFAQQAMDINDNRHDWSDNLYTLKSREEAIKRLFAKKGITVEFVGKYPKAVVEEDKRRRQEELKFDQER